MRPGQITKSILDGKTLNGFGKDMLPISGTNVGEIDDLKENAALGYILEYMCC
jgi:hypothetical protein